MIEEAGHDAPQEDLGSADDSEEILPSHDRLYEQVRDKLMFTSLALVAHH